MTRRFNVEKHRDPVHVGPRGTLELLSQLEVQALTSSAQETQLLELFRRCALAVLNTGNEIDDSAALFEAYDDFSIEVGRRTRGLKLIIKNAPASAFVDGRIVEGIRQHLFAVLRDIVYTGTDIADSDLSDSAGVTDAVFQILKHARILNPNQAPNLVVCWGGHSISRREYDYTKEVGYQLGLRGLDICTGCGPGAMKGPMKGAAVGHAKQRLRDGRYLGLSEPGIIAAEPPNPMVSHLVVMPDIEKRLEGFLRLAHGIVVFPGGVGTAEEILYLLGVLLDPANRRQELPVIFTGPAESVEYFHELDAFLRLALGDEIAERYEIVTGDAARVGDLMGKRIRQVRRQRRRDGDAYYFNWLMQIPYAHQTPFVVDHPSVAGLKLSRDLPNHELAVELRRAFSAIVTGNVKDYGIRMIQRHGPFELHSDASLMEGLDHLLRQFVAQGRMKLEGAHYDPCYRVLRV
ncbi:MAG: nucleotide 5'-monophosphate nucleosidase PpnN [Gammaproteobacteria bacterium]|nr:nucleotide 5'-monophosphate nucleosidase PpnN [Gammaproteobacteria bacterium]